MTPASRHWTLLHVTLALVVVALAAVAGREMTAIRTLPSGPPPLDGSPARPVPTLVAIRPPADPAPATSYAVIATRNLFTASRSEVAAVASVAAVGAPRPVLHGVVLDGEKSRAYLEDAPGGRVFGYAVGDPVGGGSLERIVDDRVTIRRPEGAIEVMLRDSSKPAPTTGAAATPAPVNAPRRKGSSAITPPAEDAPTPAAPSAAPPAPPGQTQNLR
jgi:hypothetical protein